ncbi:MAG: 50S ribosomal protein L3 [Pseudomonadota bacterium]|nr:50S ribosomal protein L3 [Pseudomonadota bacterium]
MANEQIGLLGRKLGMTQIFDDVGVVSAVTVLEIQPNTVIQVKSSASKDGYAALQLGYGSRKESRVTKAEIGHVAKVGARPFRVVREIRVSDAVANTHAAGSQIAIDAVFAVKQKVDVTGNSKGRGFAGVFKRWNFSGFKRSHGVHEYYRHGGSIGTRLTPGMTFKGVKMPGRMGGGKNTVQNLLIVRIDTERNLVFVRGGVPGPDGAYIVLRQAVKGKTPRKRK